MPTTIDNGNAGNGADALKPIASIAPLFGTTTIMR